MKEGFLYRIAERYVSEYGDRMREVCFVFPSVRSSLFFQKYVGQSSGMPIFAPNVTTIDKLFAALSPYRSADKIELLHILYLAYRRLSNSEIEFDDFLSLGEVLLADFSDIDKYLVDARKIFANVADLRSFDSDYGFLSERQREAIKRFWKIFNDGESAKKLNFKKTWMILPELYADFKRDLASKGIAYSGMIYREVAEKMGREQVDIQYKRVVFIGQNALCECEEKLLDYAKRNWDGDFYWDFYGKMVTDLFNRSSMFIKRYVERYPSKYEINAECDTFPEIEVVSVSSAVGQAKVAGEILKKLKGDGTAVVLPDESLLLPVLNSIPDNIPEINVTMGYTLANSSFASFMNMLSSMQLNKREKSGKAAYSHRDICAILAHPFMKFVNEDKCGELMKKIVSENLIYIPHDDGLLAAIDRDLFRSVNGQKEAIEWQLAVVEKFAHIVSPIEKEFAYSYHKAITKLKDLGIDMKLATYFRFLRMLSASVPVAFRGEPLTGLQVMGPLETRSIDFENLIILSMNEGIYPAKGSADSFIPYNLRYGFGLPVTENLDSVSAYHFYRGIYRAKKVYLIYDSRTAGIKSGEESRFIKQLKYHYRLPLVEKVSTYKVTPADVGGNSVEKIVADIPRCFSASSLNRYIDCPLKFYYNDVMKIRKEENVDEYIEADAFGTVFHRVMELLYEGHSHITAAEIDKMSDMSNVRSKIDRALDEALKLRSAYGGQLKIVSEVLGELALQTLAADRRHAPFTYIKGEETLFHDMGGGYSLVCVIDRMDEKDGELRICDYKTGFTNDVRLGKAVDDVMSKIFEGDRNGRAATTFQMLMYAYVVSRERRVPAPQVSVYKIKEIFSKEVAIETCTEELLQTFEVKLRELVENEILNPDVPFVPRPGDGRKCEYCHVRTLCGL